MNIADTKKEVRMVRGVCYRRIPIKTPVVFAGDSLTELMETYVKPHVQKDDIVFCRKKWCVFAGAARVPLDEIEPSRLALLLSRFVTLNPNTVLGFPCRKSWRWRYGSADGCAYYGRQCAARWENF